MVSTTGRSTEATRIARDGGTNVDEKLAATETGTFLGEFPYVRFGSGPENLVILPGLTLDNEPGGGGGGGGVAQRGWGVGGGGEGGGLPGTTRSM
jgi:hypothetical protein